MSRVFRCWRRYTWREMALVQGTILLPIGLCLLLSFLFSPDDVEARRGPFRWTPGCQFKMLTGRPCPTCGMSRAFCAISHGDLRRGWVYNKASLPLYLGCASGMLFSLGSVFSYWRHRRQQKGATAR